MWAFLLLDICFYICHFGFKVTQIFQDLPFSRAFEFNSAGYGSVRLWLSAYWTKVLLDSLFIDISVVYFLNILVARQPKFASRRELIRRFADLISNYQSSVSNLVTALCLTLSEFGYLGGIGSDIAVLRHRFSLG